MEAICYHAYWASTELAAKFSRVNRTQRMGDLFTEYLALWRSLGGGQFVAFLDLLDGLARGEGCCRVHRILYVIFDITSRPHPSHHRSD